MRYRLSAVCLLLVGLDGLPPEPWIHLRSFLELEIERLRPLFAAVVGDHREEAPAEAFVGDDGEAAWQ